LPAALDLIGKNFGRWHVNARLGRTATNPAVHWHCTCTCGNSGAVPTRSLVSGASRSCGCLATQLATNSKHNFKHGQSKSPAYVSWLGAKQRCFYEKHKQFKDYGGRGITMCDRWRDSFEEFLADMGPRPAGTTLDRYPNVNGNYEPGNCRWATPIEQAAGTRKRIYVDGKTLGEWETVTGIKYATLYARYTRDGNLSPNHKRLSRWSKP
jgi:hypothetical protein